MTKVEPKNYSTVYCWTGASTLPSTELGWVFEWARDHCDRLSGFCIDKVGLQ